MLHSLYSLGLAFLSLQGPVTGQKLNGPITVAGGLVQDAYLSGDYAVYLARQDSAESALFTTKLAPGFENQPLFRDPAGVRRIELPPSDGRVPFHSGGVLRSTLVNGSQGAVTVHAGPALFSLLTPADPGGRYAVYFAGASGALHLFRARLDGSVPPPFLAGPYFGGSAPQISADGSTIVFATRSSASSGYEVLAVRSSGGPVASLSHGPLPLRNFPPLLRISPDGSRAVYLFDLVASQRMELFGVPTDGSAPPQRLHPPLRGFESVGSYFDALNGSLYNNDPPFVLTPDGAHVAFVALLHRRQTRFRLFLAPIQGGALPRQLAAWTWPTELNFDDGYCLGNLAVDPTGRWIVFQEMTIPDMPSGRGRLFSVPLAGGKPVELTAGVASSTEGLPAPDVEQPSFRLSPDGTRVVFQLRTLPSLRLGLYTVPIDGSAPAEPLVLLPGGRLILRFEIHGASVLYHANPQGTNGFGYELFRVPLLGGQAPVRLNAPLVAGGWVRSFRARDHDVLYVADQDTPGRLELYYSTFP